MRAVLGPRIRYGPSVGAALLVAAALVPGLLPRSWLTQGTLTGLALALGWALGSLAARTVRPLISRLPPTPAAVLRGTVAALAGSLAVWSLWRHHLWRVDVGKLMSLDERSDVYLLAVVAVTLTVGYLAVQLGRAGRRARAWSLARLSRLLPRRHARALEVAITAVLLILVGDVVVAGRVFAAVEDAAVAADAGTDAGVQRPASPFRSGGPASDIPWEHLGRQGRAFVARGPTAAQISAFTGAPATEPIRVYVGLAAGPSAEQRADVALAEMERLGAFDRDVVLVAMPTGTGWVDPYGVDPVEYLHGGRTATVAVQYSYRPSWVQLIGNQDVARETSEALVAAVLARLDREPAASRPVLLLYGQSLGAFGSESVVGGPHRLDPRLDGALWVGPPNFSPLWRQATAEREPSSPIWQPRYAGGRTIRFAAEPSALSDPGPVWERPRIVYLQHASDPVTWWNPALLLHRPEWLEGPRGPDVPERTPYIPVVTFAQVTVDLLTSTRAPLEHGHRYGVSQARAWAAIAPPTGWSPSRTQQLLAHLTEPG